MAYFIVFFLFFIGYLFARESYVEVRILLEVPEYIKTRKVAMVGNLEELGEWKSHQFFLDTEENGLRSCTLRVPKDTRIEFKFSLGNWQSVEKGARFQEITNRRIEANSSRDYSLKVQNFAGFEEEHAPHTRVGDFEFIRKFHSRILGNYRNIAVYLPPAYKKDPKASFPVLYMHDGNNLFDAGTAFMGVEWQVDETTQDLIERGYLKDFIVVGVYNTMGRLEEYTPCKSPQHGGGKGKDYLRFLAEELMPVINKKFRTLQGPENTAIMGSSLGGLISLYAGFEFPHVFGKIGSVSPSLWWNDRYMAREYIKDKKKKDIKIWLDMGTKEGMDSQGVSQALKDTREMKKLLQKIGYIHKDDLYYYEHKNATHDEASWARRIHMPLLYFFGTGKAKVSLRKP